MTGVFYSVVANRRQPNHCTIQKANNFNPCVFQVPIPLAERPPLPALGHQEGAARAAGVAPQRNSTIPPHQGRIGSDPRLINPSIHLQLRQPGDENSDPRVDTAPHGVETPAPSAGCLLAGAHRVSSRRELSLEPTSTSRSSRGG